MKERKISKEIYVIVGVITLLIFSLGFSLGFLFDNARVKSIELQNKKQQATYESLQFQYLYLSSLENTNYSCTVLQTTLDDLVSDLGFSLDKLLEFKKDSSINEEAYSLLQRQYLLDNIRYWFFARKSKEKCGLDVVTILYFYDEKCNNCPDQGVVLTYYKKKFEDRLLVFPIDMTQLNQEPMLKVLKRVYSVEKYPTIVVEDSPRVGVVNKDDLGVLICSSYKIPPEECLKKDWLNSEVLVSESTSTTTN
jgi:hypothetical protein